MSDLEELLKNNVRESLEKMQKTNVGFIDAETSDGIYYRIDGRKFKVEVKEVDRIE